MKELETYIDDIAKEAFIIDFWHTKDHSQRADRNDCEICGAVRRINRVVALMRAA